MSKRTDIIDALLDSICAEQNNPTQTKDGSGSSTADVASPTVCGETASRETPERREIPPAPTHGSAKVASEILSIMDVYHEQEKEGDIGTPGGLEHMGDVWRLLRRWEMILRGKA